MCYFGNNFSPSHPPKLFTGHFYSINTSSCKRCPIGFFQPEAGKNFCLSCPGNSTTDYDASDSVESCKGNYCIVLIEQFGHSLLHHSPMTYSQILIKLIQNDEHPLLRKIKQILAKLTPWFSRYMLMKIQCFVFTQA